MVGFEPTTSPLSVECSNQAELHSPIVYYSVKGFFVGLATPFFFLGVYVLCSRMVLMDFVLHMLRALCVFVLCVFSACFVYAADPALSITEIMYDAEGGDEGKEFVEVVNVGSEAIDMTSVQFFERDDRPDRPGGSLAQHQGSAVLQPGGVAVIVAKPDLFLQQYSFDGVLLDTRNFALLNTGATVSLEIDGRLLHRVAYTAGDGASGDGNSLHFRDGGAVVDKPSPGMVHGVAVSDSGGDGLSVEDGLHDAAGGYCC